MWFSDEGIRQRGTNYNYLCPFYRRSASWFLRLLLRLMEGSAEVEALFAKVPFHGQRPRYLRVGMDGRDCDIAWETCVLKVHEYTYHYAPKSSPLWYMRVDKGIRGQTYTFKDLQAVRYAGASDLRRL